MKAIKPIDNSSKTTTSNVRLIVKINELIRETNRQKDEIRQVKAKLRTNAHYHRV